MTDLRADPPAAPSRPRRSTSCARSPPSSSARCCCSAAARTRSCCCAWPRRRSARPLPVPAHARRHRAQLPRGHRVPRPPRGRARRAADRRLACRTRSTPGRVVEETGPRASRNRLQTDDAARRDRRARLRRRVRRRAPRRGARAREGAHLLLPRRLRRLGPQEPAPRAVEPLQRAHPPRRARPRVPAVATGPSSTCGSTSTREDLEVPSIYFAHEREVFRRDGMLYAASRARASCIDGEQPFTESRPLPHGRRHERAPARSRRPRSRWTTSSPRSRRRGSPSAARRAPTTG